MQIEMQQIMEMERKEIKPKKEVSLTERDLGIIEMVNEMKFASLEDIYQKFFAVTNSNEQSLSDEWAKKRIFQLESAGVLKKTKAFFENTNYYQATKKGRLALVNSYPEKLFANFYSGFDLNTFHHDKMVLRSRLYLEKKGVALDWQSDRNLRQQPVIAEKGLRPYVPDGIYTTPNGRRVALEIEIAQKGKNKYQEKISSFIEHLREVSVKDRIFDVVHFICEKQRVFEIISDETRIYGNSFFVTRSDEFFNGKYEV